MPKISIITVNYNDAKGLEKTISSVVDQSLRDMEYIVVDGKSTDGSVDIIEGREQHITQWISQSDSGVYQAMNRGISLATGTYVLFLNSGDTFYDSEVLSKVSEKLDGNKDIYYGNLMFVGKDRQMLTEYPKKLTFNHFVERSLPHPGTFIKRDLFDRYFFYSEDYKIVSDWEFFIFVICKAEVAYEHLEMVISKFDLQGMSNDPKNKALIKEERTRVFQAHFPEQYNEYERREKLKVKKANHLHNKVLRKFKIFFSK